MQRLFNLTKWTQVPAGQGLSFTGDRPRKVVLDVNAPSKVVMSLLHEGRSDFLALVEGRDTVEFYVNGPFKVTATGGPCYIYTADGDGITIENLDAESFAVVRERRPRNLELEYMMAAMQENMTRRLQLQAQEIERAVSRRMGARQVQPSDARLPGRDDQEDPGDEHEEPGRAPAPPQPGRGKPKGRPGSDNQA